MNSPGALVSVVMGGSEGTLISDEEYTGEKYAE